jgi:hypothetical protein
MPYEEWKAKHQTEATAEQKAAFAERLSPLSGVVRPRSGG